MSGGSFDYLYAKPGEQLLVRLDLVDRMSDAISALVPSSRAARDTEQVRLLLVQASALISQAENVLNAGLSDVWKDVELFYSNDIWKTDAVKTIILYRLGK